MSPLIVGRLLLKTAVKLGLGSAFYGVAPLWCIPGGLRVLYYHRVNSYPRQELGLLSQEVSIAPHSFARQLDYLQRHGYTVMTAEEASMLLQSGKSFPPNAILLTFDDGYADNYLYAFPLLRERGLSALFFLATDFVGANLSFSWDQGKTPAYNRALTWREVQQMAEGNMAFGSHTKSHPRLDHLTPSMMTDELEESKRLIEQRIHRPVTSLAYPAGKCSPPVVEASREAGYTTAFTTTPGINGPGCDVFRLRRSEVSASDPLLVFALKVRGALDLLAIKESPKLRRVCDAITFRFLP